MPFLLPYLVFLLLGGICMLTWTKTEIHLYINEHTHGTADLFFRMATFFGDGILVGILVLLFLLYRIRNGLLILISGLIAGIITQTLKHTLFSHMERPKKFFEGVHQLYLVPGVENYGGHAFPSGHSASAFALYFALAIITPNKFLKFLFILIALLVGFSRIYLSQHFLQDVYAGSLLGICSTVLAFMILTRIEFFRKASRMDYSFFKSRI